MNINLFIQMTQLLGVTYGHLEGNCKIDIEQKKTLVGEWLQATGK